MKVKVLRSFRDIYSGDLHKKNTEILISKERLEEINSTALGVLVKEVKEKKDKK